MAVQVGSIHLPVPMFSRRTYVQVTLRWFGLVRRFEAWEFVGGKPSAKPPGSKPNGGKQVDVAVVGKNGVSTKMGCPGRWTHGRFNLRSISWWLNFDPCPYVAERFFV